jgi:hypothetical protein
VVEEVTPPTAGLDWACRLLFGSGGPVAARRRGEPAPAGFERTEAYLALPRAANPRLLVPLGSPRAAAAALARNHDATSQKARLARAALGAGLKVGLTQRVADRVDVFVDPALSPAERPQHLLTEHLREIFGPPAFVAAGPWGELELIAASALPNAARPDPAQVFDPPMAVIAEIAGLWGRSTARLADSPYWVGVRQRLAAQGDGSDVLQRAVGWIERRHGHEDIAFGAWHGDFTPWNMARLGDTTYLWDWERAAPAPAGLDLLHFLFQGVCRFEGKSPAAAVTHCSERLASLLPVLDVPAGSERALWLLYRLELLFRYDEARMTGVLARPSKIHEGILEMFDRDMEG